MVAALALLAFAFQSYVTQTHIHFVSSSSSSSFGLSKLLALVDSKAGKAIGTSGRNGNKAPANDEAMKCPLCQAVGYAGHFVAPSQAALLLPTAAISVLPVAIFILSPREILSHNWLGRGPPHS